MEIERGSGRVAFKFERFEAWKRAVDFADHVLEVADGLPQRYQFSLGEQLRRAVVSVPTNLSEGSGRDNPRERACLYGVAKGSLYEVISLLVVAGKRELISRDTYRELYREADELAAMVSGAINRARERG
jgi:four helix bundle protein